MKSLLLILTLMLGTLLGRPAKQAQDPVGRFVENQPNATWHELDWQHWLKRTNPDYTHEDYQTADGSEVDLLSATHAWEIDYCHNKWKEAIGQALFYGIATNRRPGIVLLMGKQSAEVERWHLLRCMTVCAKYGIELRTVDMKKQY